MLLDINTWWQSMPLFEQIFWVIAFVFSLLFLIQTILSFAAGDGDTASGHADDYVGDDSGIMHGFFTIKNMIAFFTIFGWTGIACIKGDMSKPATVGIALAAGCVMVFMMLFIMRSMGRLRESGTLEIRNALNQVAETYLSIPAARGGFGKVHIKVQGSLRELQAITDDEQIIPTGKLVKVINVMNDSVLVVTSRLS
jgi:hypothetical protein